ncbi:acetylornithine aminotransferase [Methanocaldococcus villosus KIN24-T80]|uniref:Acetylornithine aminotransferase n=1 Tax=Methanocaldococcus villosus KIN24-T80 TaxID=1069083 RepID=N6VRT9_9EURY|nr:aspartate aminotransferase family protein [Methanocaldococcus villosus]ENN96570.1 acetylornithine aminotransferase [Methanocaldococcus villosus KIN24-T80]
MIELERKYHLQVYRRYPVVIVKGRGMEVYDINNKKYLDFIAGIGVNNAGHCHPKIVEAIKNQAENLIHVSNLFYNIPQIELAKRLVGLSKLDKAFFCNSGTEAIEGVIKFARKYANKILNKKGEIITFYNAFHGRTYGALSATPKDRIREGFEPLLEGFKHLPFNNIEALKEGVDNNTIAIMLELVQGEGGVNVAEMEFVKTIADICEDKNILLIVDEIQTGIGRTGKMFAFEHYGIEPDMVTLAKALAGGLPIGAVLLKEEIEKALNYGDHGSTFGGNPLVCSAALANLSVIEELIRDNKVLKKGEYFLNRLKELDYEFIKDVRGLGLMIGVELEFNGNKIVEEMLKRGFLINCTSEKVLRFLPPLIVEKEEIDLLVDNLNEVFKNYSE